MSSWTGDASMAQAARRRAGALIELLVVITIIGILIALWLPAMQKARAAAIPTVCAYDFWRVGIALLAWHEGARVLPHARECPAPCRGGKDPFCRTLPSPGTYTGPGEKWWAPYDNRPGSSPTKALAGYMPDG